MPTKTLALAASLVLCLSGGAYAGTPAADGLMQGAPTGYTAMKRKKSMKRMSRRDMAPTATRGSTGGRSTGNGTTGSGAAPSGQ
ncbi:hypothetical protein [Methylobacterium iners]|uniref:Uncharacterized protein n=1 Tax=Methylobacterium iners TaxID=418707 RepID=A0ABQ4RVG5_9HYPH|nr:hypothetical protein [Methylobacterium iners]GJD94823.1 hypothetical protein OCOJLMKI_2029 [Methylobacterium iners]